MRLWAVAALCERLRSDGWPPSFDSMPLVSRAWIEGTCWHMPTKSRQKPMHWSRTVVASTTTLTTGLDFQACTNVCSAALRSRLPAGFSSVLASLHLGQPRRGRARRKAQGRPWVETKSVGQGGGRPAHTRGLLWESLADIALRPRHVGFTLGSGHRLRQASALELRISTKVLSFDLAGGFWRPREDLNLRPPV